MSAPRRHGGKRSNAGRRPRSDAPGRNVTVRLSPADEAELTGGIRDGETLSTVLRDGGLHLVRSRR